MVTVRMTTVFGVTSELNRNLLQGTNRSGYQGVHVNTDTTNKSTPLYTVIVDVSNIRYTVIVDVSNIRYTVIVDVSNIRYTVIVDVSNIRYTVIVDVSNIRYTVIVDVSNIREANVIIKHLDRAAPVVAEYVVGPLPSPSYHYPNPRREKLEVPYRYHPTYGVKAAYNALFSSMSRELLTIIEESYGASFVDCKDKCLVILPQKTSSAYSDRTIVVLYIIYKAEFPTVNTVGMMFLMKEKMAGKHLEEQGHNRP
ncbi:hypothetical protein Btru_065746 [Bulinus truncatus]|nr:hypothetical protein Btru_065746 [Bulinus truncatus]